MLWRLTMNMDFVASILAKIAVPALFIFLAYSLYKSFFKKGHSK